MIKILLIGCGNMGSAMLYGWQNANLLSSQSFVIDPNHSKLSLKNINSCASVKSIPADFQPDVVIFAVKPKQILKIAAEYAHYRSAVFISVAAGINSDNIASIIGRDKAIIRAMPNIPATIGEGMTACYHNNNVNKQQYEMSEKLFHACGDMIVLLDEDLIHCATALSGSGSAYIFLMIEAMIAAGEKLGMSRDVATTSAVQTALGAAKMVKISKKSPALLRQFVTSPHGTTQAAMDVFLHGDQFIDLVGDAMLAAHERSVEIEEEKE